MRRVIKYLFGDRDVRTLEHIISKEKEIYRLRNSLLVGVTHKNISRRLVGGRTT